MDTRSLLFDNIGRLRSGWRFGIFVVAFVFAVLFVGGIGAGLLTLLTPDAAGVGFVTGGILILIPALLVGWLCGKYLEGVPFRALGAWFTKRWFVHLLLGILAGAATLGLAVLITIIFGGLRFELNPADSRLIFQALLSSLLIFAVGAAWEEAVFRGYILQTFNRSGLGWIGIALTSLFFGAIHLHNPNATAISTTDTAVAGVWFGIAYLKTRDLWFVWGMHLIWNWMQGAIFGIEVSGITTLVSEPFLREIDSGPAWLTGESYGIEGGIASTFALIVSTVVIYFLPLRPSEEMKSLTDPQVSHPTGQISTEGARVI